MKCEIPGCKNDACKTFHARGIFYGIYLDEDIQTCENHKPEVVNMAVYNKNAIMVNPYLESQKLKKTGS